MKAVTNLSKLHTLRLVERTPAVPKAALDVPPASQGPADYGDVLGIWYGMRNALGITAAVGLLVWLLMAWVAS